jgi:hypothetical protein
MYLGRGLQMRSGGRLRFVPRTVTLDHHPPHFRRDRHPNAGVVDHHDADRSGGAGQPVLPQRVLVREAGAPERDRARRQQYAVMKPAGLA